MIDPAMMQGASILMKGVTGAPVSSRADGGYADGYAYNSSPYDGSNWTVATGSGKASASNIPWSILAVAAVVIVVLIRKKG